jgi:hypothetical protein
MRKLLFAAMLTIISLTSILASAPNALAEERSCRGTIGAVTLDNVRVPQGQTCTLNGTRLKGNIKVERDATLIANGVRVVGSVQAENARLVTVQARSRINGDVQHKQGQAATIVDSVVGGTILFDENRGTLDASRNAVSGNVQAFKNSGGLSIFNNTVDENLQCKENVPAPLGGGNVVDGNKEDQCAGF